MTAAHSTCLEWSYFFIIETCIKIQLVFQNIEVTMTTSVTASSSYQEMRFECHMGFLRSIFILLMTQFSKFPFFLPYQIIFAQLLGGMMKRNYFRTTSLNHWKVWSLIGNREMWHKNVFIGNKLRVKNLLLKNDFLWFSLLKEENENQLPSLPNAFPLF